MQSLHGKACDCQVNVCDARHLGLLLPAIAKFMKASLSFSIIHNNWCMRNLQHRYVAVKVLVLVYSRSSQKHCRVPFP